MGHLRVGINLINFRGTISSIFFPDLLTNILLVHTSYTKTKKMKTRLLLKPSLVLLLKDILKLRELILMKPSLHFLILEFVRFLLGLICYFDIWSPRDTIIKLVGYFDVDWTGFNDDRKNTFEGCFYLGNYSISWYSKNQS